MNTTLVKRSKELRDAVRVEVDVERDLRILVDGGHRTVVLVTRDAGDGVHVWVRRWVDRGFGWQESEGRARSANLLPGPATGGAAARAALAARTQLCRCSMRVFERRVAMPPRRCDQCGLCPRCCPCPHP